MTKYVSKDGNIEITGHQTGKGRISWACHINGSYKVTKVLYSCNASVVQNFGFLAEDFAKVEE